MREVKTGSQFRKDLKRYRNDKTKLEKLYDIVGYTENILLLLTNWQNRLEKRQTRKFVSQFPDTHREVAHLVLMTVYLQQESERRQQN